MQILNLTQHAATTDQVAAGVVEPADKKAVQALITFDELPTSQEILRRADRLAVMASESSHKKALIGGAPFFMGPLEDALWSYGVEPVYAFSKRESADEKQPDGSVKKIQVFRHAGFIPAVPYS